MKLSFRILILGLSCLGVASPAGAAEPIRADQLKDLLATIKPGKDEDRWSTIPWMTDLWQARQFAAKEGKPILLWEMDGHPLGCT